MDAEHAARRALFPRGLVQPEGGFRFGADTLLLSAFAHRQLKPRAALCGLDLGCGCGAASFGLLVLPGREGLDITGIDVNPAMTDAARQNALALGLADRFRAWTGDADDCSTHDFPIQGPAHFALCNPPFRIPETGRACPNQAKQLARFEGPGGFAVFARCAARRLRRGGSFFLVHLAERLPELFQHLTQAGLHPRRLLPVQGRSGGPIRIALAQAVSGQGRTLVLEPPLVLYDEAHRLTPEAERFCPHLGANPDRRRTAPNAGGRPRAPCQPD